MNFQESAKETGLSRSLPAIILRGSFISHRRGRRFGAVGFGIRFGRRCGSCVLPFALRRCRPTLHGLGGGRSRGGVHACGSRGFYSRSRRLHGRSPPLHEASSGTLVRRRGLPAAGRTETARGMETLSHFLSDSGRAWRISPRR